MFLIKFLRQIFILPIKFYKKFISPLLPSSCIYHPSCSTYSMQSILKHGILKGFFLSLFRIFRCIGGLYTGGNDPVPKKFSLHYLFGSYPNFWRFNKKKK